MPERIHTKTVGQPVTTLQASADLAPVIHHGTPMTPRAALKAVMPGRAACVSFAHPQDVEVVEALCPRIMFRQRRVHILASGGQARRGLGRRAARLQPLLRVAGATPEAGAMGGDTRPAWCAEPVQRRPSERLAVRSDLWRSALAYGRPDRSPGAPMWPLRQGRVGLDRRPEERARRLSALSGTHEGRWPSLGLQLAAAPHDARDCGGLRLSVRQRRQHELGAERVAL